MYPGQPTLNIYMKNDSAIDPAKRLDLPTSEESTREKLLVGTYELYPPFDSGQSLHINTHLISIILSPLAHIWNALKMNPRKIVIGFTF